ncbi:MAG TPA: hypothetical protein PK402_10760 [Tepidisphaeraceae bacterium]|nr:hypothetical protein [Tepidisphaeraceae bacterium]
MEPFTGCFPGIYRYHYYADRETDNQLCDARYDANNSGLSAACVYRMRVMATRIALPSAGCPKNVPPFTPNLSDDSRYPTPRPFDALAFELEIPSDRVTQTVGDKSATIYGCVGAREDNCAVSRNRQIVSVRTSTRITTRDRHRSDAHEITGDQCLPDVLVLGVDLLRNKDYALLALDDVLFHKLQRHVHLASNTIDREGEHDVDLIVVNRLEQRLKTRTTALASGDCFIDEDVGFRNIYVVLFRPLVAFAKLISGGLLKAGRKASINGATELLTSTIFRARRDVEIQFKR